MRPIKAQNTLDINPESVTKVSNHHSCINTEIYFLYVLASTADENIAQYIQKHCIKIVISQKD